MQFLLLLRDCDHETTSKSCTDDEEDEECGESGRGEHGVLAGLRL